MDKKQLKNEFYSQGKLPVLLENAYDKITAYTLEKTGQVVYEFTINAGLGDSNEVEISQITDLHFNYATKEELETDEEIIDTVKNRVWLKNGESVNSAINSIKGASFSDLVVVTGDILDYLSKGAINLTKKHIFKPYPNALCVAGGHELTKQMQTGNPDKLPLEERVEILKEFWVNDFYYEKRLVGSKVVVIGLNNGFGKYFDFQAEKLEKDIAEAKKLGKIILIFQHEPLSTRNENDKIIKNFFQAYGNPTTQNIFDKNNLLCVEGKTSEVDEKVYALITKNADVIKGVFVGHWHSGYYTELSGSYKKGDKIIHKKIPQILAPATPYFDKGCFVRIIVK